MWCHMCMYEVRWGFINACQAQQVWFLRKCENEKLREIPSCVCNISTNHQYVSKFFYICKYTIICTLATNIFMYAELRWGFINACQAQQVWFLRKYENEKLRELPHTYEHSMNTYTTYFRKHNDGKRVKTTTTATTATY